MATKTKTKKISTNGALIQAFFRGDKEGEVNNLRIAYRVDSIALIHYQTCIAEYRYETKTLYFNTTIYSTVTSRVQRLIKTYMPYSEIKIEKCIECAQIKQDDPYLFQ
jgi:hypothetical protein